MKKLIYLLFAGLTFLSCSHNEDSYKNKNPETTDPTISITNQTKIKVESVSGTILDENGNPVANAKITAGAVKTTTDANGLFSVENVMLNQNLGFVTVEKEGYFSGSRSFASLAAGNEIEVILMKKELVKTFTSSLGTILSLQSGDVITFKPNSIKNESTGRIYNGEVNVYAKAIDVEREAYLAQMPGDLVAVNKDGVDGSLYSYGMLYVELETPSGEKLNIATRQTVTIEHPIPDSMLTGAPKVLPFWFFDETKGYWSEYNTSSYKVGKKYIVEVPHFTKLNWDAWLKPCWLTGIIIVPCKPLPNPPPPTCPVCPNPPPTPPTPPACLTCPDDPIILPEALVMSGAYVRIHLDSPEGKVIAEQKTSSDGSFKIKVPKNFTDKYYIEVVNKPNNTASKEILAKFKLIQDNGKSLIDLGKILVAHPKDNYAQTYGTITDCNGNKATTGNVTITYRKKFSRSAPVKNGFYGLVYSTSDNLYESINEVIKTRSETAENTFLKANKFHRIDFKLDAAGKTCVGTNTEIKSFLTYIINGVTTTYNFAETNKKTSYKGGIYVKASETKGGLDKLSQGIYVLLPDFKGTGVYNASVLVLKTLNGHTVTQQNPNIKLTITSFDETKAIIKGTGKGTFTENTIEVPIEFNFEMKYINE